MSKNLTGSRRIIHDGCIDIYNAIQKWRSLLLESHKIILNIWKEKENNSQELTTEEHLNIDFSPEVFASLEKLSSTLQSKVTNMELLVRKMKNTVSKLNAVSELSDLHQSSSMNDSTVFREIPFKTWQLSKFCDVAEEITSMFEDEFSVKSSICKEICTIREKSAFLIFEACWKYESTIDTTRLNILLDGIIWELGLYSEFKPSVS